MGAPPRPARRWPFSVVEDRGDGEVVAGAPLGLAIEGAGPPRGLGGDGLGVVDANAVDVEVQAAGVQQPARGDDLVEDLVAVGEHLVLRGVDEVGPGVLGPEKLPARVVEEAVVAAVVDDLRPDGP
jgi:hypothetical protein